MSVITTKELATALGTDPKHLRRFLRKWWCLSGKGSEGGWKWDREKDHGTLLHIVHSYCDRFGCDRIGALILLRVTPQATPKGASDRPTGSNTALVVDFADRSLEFDFESPREKAPAPPVPQVEAPKWWPIGKLEPRMAETCSSVLKGANLKANITETNFEGRVWGEVYVYGTRDTAAKALDIWTAYRTKHI